MNYKQAKRKSYIFRVVGLCIAIPAFISTIVSFLKYLYFGMSDGSPIGESLAKPFKQISYYVYDLTSNWLWLFWEYSPTPDIFNIKSQGNILFLIILGVIGVGMACYAHGSDIAKILRTIDKEVQKQSIRDSLTGSRKRNQKQIKDNLNIEKPSVFSIVHGLYIAPLVVGVLLIVMTKILE